MEIKYNNFHFINLENTFVTRENLENQIYLRIEKHVQTVTDIDKILIRDIGN